MPEEKLKLFSDFYHGFYGVEWSKLFDSLGSDCGKIGRPNLWAKPMPVSCKIFSHQDPEPPPLSSNSILDFYNMDRASAVVPYFMEISSGQNVLDMCAAPGGKSLIIWELMNASGKLVLNDISQSRRFKLKNIINSYIPKQLQHGIQISGMDANKFGLRYPNTFDRVLLDAPCSSESHVVRSAKALSNWTPSKTRQLSARQFSLICSALSSLKKGGLLCYSTCSISPHENDEVIKKIMKRKKHPCEFVQIKTTLGTQTEMGRLFLPNRHKMGPIFFSLLRKL